MSHVAPDTSQTPAGGAGVVRGDARLALRIALLSAFLLYLEVMLVRWLGTELRIFAYFKNLTLIACFLGMGIGCLRADRAGRFAMTFVYLIGVAALVVAPRLVGVPVHEIVTASLGGFNDFAVWTWSSRHSGDIMPAVLSLLFLVAVFGLTALTCVPGGRLLGRLFRSSSNNLAAYTANILGSIVGVWLFSFVCFASIPPVAWLLILVVLGVVVAPARRELSVLGPAGAALVLLAMADLPNQQNVIWSPYQKLQYKPTTVSSRDGATVDIGFSVAVNGTFYQRAVNFDESFLAAHRELWPDLGDPALAAYNLVYRLVPHPARVLVVGAGTGNDVAAALRNGAGAVDAVEIDPEIVRLGRQRHPETPYSDPRVRVVVDDARAFFHRAKPGYDLVVFGALDSHTLNSSLTNLRIDNFVYTVEAFREVRDLLAPDGVLWVVFSVERPFIGSRIAGMLSTAFETPPVIFDNPEARGFQTAGGGATFLVTRDGATRARVELDEAVSQIVSRHRIRPRETVEDATDDWPYLYLEQRSIPGLYRVVTVAILFLTVLVIRPSRGHEGRAVNLVYFFLGAAFLLVEVQSISKLSLLFGSTWLVSAAAITGVLVMVFAANILALSRGHVPSLPVVLALAVTLVVNTVFPFRALLALPGAARLGIAGGVMSLPIFFAGLLFASLFAHDRQPHIALAWNLLGSIVGGLTESMSFVIGLNSLGLIALGLYLVATLLLVRDDQRQVHAIP